MTSFLGLGGKNEIMLHLTSLSRSRRKNARDRGNTFMNERKNVERVVNKPCRSILSHVSVDKYKHILLAVLART